MKANSDIFNKRLGLGGCETLVGGLFGGGFLARVLVYDIACEVFGGFLLFFLVGGICRSGTKAWMDPLDDLSGLGLTRGGVGCRLVCPRHSGLDFGCRLSLYKWG